ncbi:helix-turn-helix domain-containing protein [Amycolatopsis sp. NPDC026612]|uniref:ArsR/SmtB family transcription factor n=1 Tax=Amycolatopsis sp. NPDC026612 TaxID=3155466 RepID=UPI0033EB7C3D
MASRTSTPLDHPALEDVSFSAALEALRDPHRLAMVAALAREPGQPCGAIMPPVSKPAASRHFKILRAAGLLQQWDCGTQRLNALRREEFDARFPGLLGLALAEAAQS